MTRAPQPSCTTTRSTSRLARQASTRGSNGETISSPTASSPSDTIRAVSPIVSTSTRMRRRVMARSRRSVRRSSGAGAGREPGAGSPAAVAALCSRSSSVLRGWGPASRAASWFGVGAHRRHGSSGGLRPRSRPGRTLAVRCRPSPPGRRSRERPGWSACPALLRERILVLDGAMGTMIQRHGFTEADFRGERFADHPRDLRGDNDLLCLTRPDVDPRHPRRLPGGRRRHHQHQHLQRDPHRAGRLRPGGTSPARSTRPPPGSPARPPTPPRPRDGRPRFVAGSLGPTNRTASISPDVNDPAARNVTFGELAAPTARPPRACRGRRGPPAHRDHLRHAQRQGRDLRDRGGVRGLGPPAPGHDQRHHRGRLGPDAVGPDAGGVLDQRPPRRPAARRPQLRARRQAAAEHVVE